MPILLGCKWCPKCTLYLALRYWGKDKSHKDGYDSYCKSCRSEYRKEHKETEVVRRKRVRDEVFAAYGNECVCCGEVERAFLCIDHIDGGGKKERGTGSNINLYTRIRREDFPSRYRILCHNCNQARSILGHCPHGGV